MKRFVLCFVFCIAVIFGGTAFYNYKYDTYGFFNTDFSSLRYEVSYRFVKTRYLLDNPQKYDAYCFGSSVVATVDLAKANNGLRYYNMAYSCGMPTDWLEDIRLLIKHRVNMRQILIGIDDFSFLDFSYQKKEARLQLLPYCDTGTIETYLSILLRKPSYILPISDRYRLYYDAYGTGRWFYCRWDEEIEKDVEAHIHGEPLLHGTIFAKAIDSARTNRMDDAINELRELKNIADENGIELIVFINPVQRTRYLGNDLPRFGEFKRRLADVLAFYDFSGVNAITANNYFFYDPLHYRPMVGDMIVQRIFHPEKGTDFGVFVTKDNVEEHLQRLDQQAVEAYRAVIWGYDGSLDRKARPNNTGDL